MFLRIHHSEKAKRYRELIRIASSKQTTTNSKLMAIQLQSQQKKKVLVAGASGYLGRYLVDVFQNQGWEVTSLVRCHKDDLPNQVVAQASDKKSLEGIMKGVDLVVSSLGITRQRDGLTYRDVDFQCNKNLLEEAITSKVPQFAYIHVLNGDIMSEQGVVAIQAKQEFCDLLQASDIQSTIVCPSGFFSDMRDFLDMAQSGRAYLFGEGSHIINPIHGADLAKATFTAVAKKQPLLKVGGPDTFSHKELAELAFEVLKKPAKITYMPDWIRRFACWFLPKVTPTHVGGPAQFFLAAFGMDMAGQQVGDHHLKDFFTTAAEEMKSEKTNGGN